MAVLEDGTASSAVALLAMWAARGDHGVWWCVAEGGLRPEAWRHGRRWLGTQAWEAAMSVAKGEMQWIRLKPRWRLAYKVAPHEIKKETEKKFVCRTKTTDRTLRW